ncbi:response regulator [Paenibacillus alginolyticus]|uniref:Response regulator transcription factor n=1 Tax=Paenibacillus alginolyticus TaxID=59839 RepID=A0ABT4GIY5_9BACL|nr:response regulator transcription factor [Paenibacillus alginolyticus]MCY9696162.1 response regulator transcription factor [Paenibacillus alginolyticus]MEC0143315.1 response regulator transcription factor [Paenibacillus alginolyticus]
MKSIRVLVIDDHELARAGIRSILAEDPTFEVIGEGKNGIEAISLTEKLMPDIILMDINMQEMNGLEATKRIKILYPYVKIVMVTVSDDITDLFEALKQGAQGYLHKNLNSETWHEYLRAIAFDEAPMTRELAFRILREFSHKENSPSDSNPLTTREQEILGLIAKGCTNRDIAENLYIAENTVKNHLKNILQKLHLENRLQLARYAYENGYFQR